MGSSAWSSSAASNFTRSNSTKSTNQVFTQNTARQQGNFRTAILDVDLLRYAIDCDSVYAKDATAKNLVVTCLDQTGKHFKGTIGGQAILMDPYKLASYLFDESSIGKILMSSSPSSQEMETFKYISKV